MLQYDGGCPPLRGRSSRAAHCGRVKADRAGAPRLCSDWRTSSTATLTPAWLQANIEMIASLFFKKNKCYNVHIQDFVSGQLHFPNIYFFSILC